jgi:hypothetical protein
MPHCVGSLLVIIVAEAAATTRIGVVPKQATIGCLECRDNSLPTPKIWMHIAVEVVSLLKMAQQMMSLSVEEHLLVDFLLDHILMLKVVVV